MARHLVKRILAAAVVIVGISMVTFVLLHLVSSSPGRAALGEQATVQAVAAFNKEHGYDDPLVVQYVHYVGQLLHGDLGFSYRLNQPVTSLLKENVARSAYLSGVSLVLAIVIAIPVGVYQAVRRNSVADYTLTAGAFTLYSMPSFFVGLLLIQAFALSLHVFPAQASQATGVLGVITDPRAMVLPVVSLTAVHIARYSRYMRSSALDNLAQDYLRLARAKGLPERLVLTRHLLRNASLPLITLVGLSVPSLLAGNLLIETLFNYPGLGLLFFTALGNEDYPVLLAYTLIAGVLTVLGNLLADIVMSMTDPRIRFS